MKSNPIIIKLIPLLLIFSLLCFFSFADINAPTKRDDDVQSLKNLLEELKNKSGNEIFTLHLQSVLDVINSKPALTKTDSSILQITLDFFINPDLPGNASSFNSYLNRGRDLVISWVSPTDGETSFLRLRLPKNWNPNITYPLYVELHGLWGVADNPIDYMTYSFRNGPSNSMAFEDGYQILPWGRGNHWYQGISETDVWEGIELIKNLLNIDPRRMYLTGHSMGGFGAWYIACRSSEVWAALGLHAGALWYAADSWLTDDKIEIMSQLPIYFVVGTNDGLYNINLATYNTLLSIGNNDTEFVTFSGGHEYVKENVENMYLWLRKYVNYDYTGDKRLTLSQNSPIEIFPNPVSSSLNIKVHTENYGQVKFDLFDFKGRKLETLIDRFLDKGDFFFSINRVGFNSGIYFYKLTADNNCSYGKILLK